MKGWRWRFVLIGFVVFMNIGFLSRGLSQVHIQAGIKVPPPPPLLLPEPPPLVVVPRTYVYFAPEIEVDLYFYRGYWYRPFEGYWYRSKSHKGPWVHLVPEKVPVILVKLPPDVRQMTLRHKRMPPGHVMKHWKSWEREKYWEKHGGKEWHLEDRSKPAHKGKGKPRH